MTNFSEFLDEFDSKLIGQAEMLCNFVNLVDIMLLFIRATWQGIWDLHVLASLEMFVKYFFFFTYYQINYARFTPVYLSEKFALKTQDQKSWEFLESGNF